MVRFARRAIDICDALRLHGPERCFPESVFGFGFVLYILIFYPGFMSNDSANQILQARSGIYTDLHPPTMAFIWSFIDAIYPGPSGMLVLQSVLIWLGAYLTYRAYLSGRRGFIFASALAAILFTPPIFGIAGAIWKDTLMWGMFFVAIGLVGHIKPIRKNNVTRHLVLVVSLLFLLILGAAVRWNGVIATIAILAMMIYRTCPENWTYKILTSLVGGVCIAGVILVISFSINRALTVRQDNAWGILALFEIVGTIKHSRNDAFREELYEGIPASIRAKSSLNSALDAYTPRNVMKLFGSHGGPFFESGGSGFGRLSLTDLATLRSTWLRGVSEQPIAWLTHRWAVFEHVLGLTPPSLVSFAMMRTNGFSEKYKNLYGTNPTSSWFQQGIEWRLQKSSDYWFFRPWFYFVILNGIVLGSLIFNRYLDSDIFFIASSGIMHEATLFFIAPAADYRYSQYMVFSCLLAILLILRKISRNPAKTNTSN